MNLILFIVLVALAVFLFVLALILPAFGDRARVRKLLKRRLVRISAEIGDQQDASLMREKYLRNLSTWQRDMENLPLMEPLAKLIEQSGGTLLAHQVVIAALVLSSLAALAVGLVIRNPFAVVAAAGVGAAAPFLKLRFDRNRRFAKLEEQLPDAIEIMRRALRAGHPFSAALKLVADDIEQPMSREFEQTFADINYGSDPRRALLGLLERVPSVTMMSFVTAVQLQRETGGNLAEILEQIAKVVRARFKFNRKIRALSAEGRLSAWVLAIVPVFLIGAISVAQPAYLPILINTQRGQKLVGIAICLMIVGVAWIRRLLRIEI